MVELKPCPFCGAPGYLVGLPTTWLVKCTDTDCTARGRESAFSSDAVGAWNRRAQTGMGWIARTEDVSDAEAARSVLAGRTSEEIRGDVANLRGRING